MSICGIAGVPVYGKLEVSAAIGAVLWRPDRTYCPQSNLHSILTGVGSKSADFICETCGKWFASLEHLQQHRQWRHTERTARRHACAYCPYTSSNRSHVTRHERGHTGERPFVCQVCQNGYRRREDLRAHVRAHSRQRGVESASASPWWASEERPHTQLTPPVQSVGNTLLQEASSCRNGEAGLN